MEAVAVSLCWQRSQVKKAIERKPVMEPALAPAVVDPGAAALTAGLAEVQEKIAHACTQARRDPKAVTLIGASKTVPAEAVTPFLEAGLRVFGENRVQEAAQKWPALRERYSPLELHLIGPLQSNKAAQAVALFDVIHSLDRPSLCAALARAGEKQQRRLKFFVQVNTGEEPQKAGVPPQEVDRFIASCRRDYGLELLGLMCIPPVDEPAAPHFQALADMAARNGLAGLSMGMSSDYPLAIAQGATHVRVGNALFGARGRSPTYGEAASSATS